MTINVNITDVATAIKGLTITGVKIYDLNEIPVNAMMVTPCLFPDITNFVSGIDPNIETYGTAGNEKITLNYSLNYVYAHSPIGQNLNMGIWKPFIQNTALILKTFLENDTLDGCQDIRVGETSQFGTVIDPSGNTYNGCVFTLNIQQFCEVA